MRPVPSSTTTTTSGVGAGVGNSIDRPDDITAGLGNASKLTIARGVKVRVEVYTNEVEDDGNGHPGAIDSKLIDLKVPHLTLADVTAALSSAIDLSAWTIASYWEPVPDAEF